MARTRSQGYVSAYEVEAVYYPNPLTVDYLVVAGGGAGGGRPAAGGYGAGGGADNVFVQASRP